MFLLEQIDEVARLDIKLRLVMTNDIDATEIDVDARIREHIGLTQAELIAIRDTVDYSKCVRVARKRRNSELHDILLSEAYRLSLTHGLPANVRVPLLIGTLNATRVKEDKEDADTVAPFVFNLHAQPSSEPESKELKENKSK